MNGYCAHIIMVVELKQGAQERHPVWENVILVAANGEEEAFDKAERRGRADEGDDDGSFCWGGEPARWVFAGVRKLTECQDVSERPDDGTEVTFNELELKSLGDVRKLVAGSP